MHRILYLLCFWAAFVAGISPAMAASYTIQGQINAEQANVPLDAIDVVLIAFPLGQETVIYTELDGTYSATIEIPGDEEILFLVGALDICIDQVNTQFVTVAPGATVIQDFTICRADGTPSDCECGSEVEEVCVEVTAGLILPFPNACEALCAGFDSTNFVDCVFENPNDHPNDCECPFEGEEVCVIGEHGTLLHYPNACWAECDGYSLDDFVDCGTNPNACVCEPDSTPVCVEFVLGATISFPNACEAFCYGFTEAQFVDCDGQEEPEDCACPNEGEEVCVFTQYGFVIHYPNACEAECDGYTETDFVDCGEDPYDCGCEADSIPICAQIAPGIIISFPSVCDANCFGFLDTDLVDCETGENPNDCGCPAGGNPVCVFVDSITILQFPNLCEAECAGYHADSFVDCDPGGEDHPSPCGCEAEAESVCVEIFPGYVIPLPSVCELLCLGFDSTAIVDCNEINDPYDCECPFDGEPVCVQITPEVIVVFPNACTAECGGYTEFVDCDLDPGEEPEANCGCEEVADPVCVAISPDVVIPFLNPCSAECAGFDASQFVSCGEGLIHNNVFTHSYAEPGEWSGLRSSEVYPNPAFDLIQVRTDWAVETEAEVQIVTMSGQVMKALRFGTAEGPQQWTISIDELPSGLYLLQINSAEGQRVEKFVKQ